MYKSKEKAKKRRQCSAVNCYVPIGPFQVYCYKHSEEYKNKFITELTFTVSYSKEDSDFLGLCKEYPSLSWLAESPEKALSGIIDVVCVEKFDFLIASS